jgi:asparagine synthase (glutamine-hydrolysing)
MSVQFGVCNFDGKPVDLKEFHQVRPVIAPYGPDGEGYVCKDNLGMLYRAFFTTRESRCEIQPYTLASGAVLTWDGRLDNRKELIGHLGRDLSASSDLAMAAAAYEKWQTGAFAKLIGDWALSVWDWRHRSLILAKDFVGSRHLYYSVEKDRVTWCTILDPLVLFAGHSFALEEEYIAGWLSFFPATHLTPYAGICSVPPSSFVRLAKGTRETTKYWDFDPAKRILYRADSEYEEHFRDVFVDSVRRRLRSNSPVLAELSGGMDSSSIVSVGDDIITRGLAETPRLDTISYYDDYDPNWNERPYFRVVEAKRGRVGCHIDAGSQESFPSLAERGAFAATPSSCGGSHEVNASFAACRTSQGNRVVLSGIGGDEVTGGIPTPVPELQDLLVKLRFALLAHQLKVWALDKRQPWFYLLRDAVRQFLPRRFPGSGCNRLPAAGLHKKFAARCRATLTGYECRTEMFGSLPSFQTNISSLGMLRRQLSSDVLSSDPPYEKRFPFLDRDLLEFLYSVPRTQLVRPGQRRSLLRRALAGVVPDEILSRRRKAYVSRFVTSPLRPWISSIESGEPFLSHLLGFVDAGALCEILNVVIRDQKIPNVILLRIFCLELWLRSIGTRNILALGSSMFSASGQIRVPQHLAGPSKAEEFS